MKMVKYLRWEENPEPHIYPCNPEGLSAFITNEFANGFAFDHVPFIETKMTIVCEAMPLSQWNDRGLKGNELQDDEWEDMEPDDPAVFELRDK